jgi:hypothetical protein
MSAISRSFFVAPSQFGATGGNTLAVDEYLVSLRNRLLHRLYLMAGTASDWAKVLSDLRATSLTDIATPQPTTLRLLPRAADIESALVRAIDFNRLRVRDAAVSATGTVARDAALRDHLRDVVRDRITAFKDDAIAAANAAANDGAAAVAAATGDNSSSSSKNSAADACDVLMFELLTNVAIREAITLTLGKTVQSHLCAREKLCATTMALYRLSGSQIAPSSRAFGPIVAAIVPSMMSALSSDVGVARTFIDAFSNAKLTNAASSLVSMLSASSSDSLVQQVALVSLGQLSTVLFGDKAHEAFFNVFMPLIADAIGAASPNGELRTLVTQFTTLLASAVRDGYPTLDFVFVAKVLRRAAKSSPLAAHRLSLCSSALLSSHNIDALLHMSCDADALSERLPHVDALLGAVTEAWAPAQADANDAVSAMFHKSTVSTRDDSTVYYFTRNHTPESAAAVGRRTPSASADATSATAATAAATAAPADSEASAATPAAATPPTAFGKDRKSVRLVRAMSIYGTADHQWSAPVYAQVASITAVRPNVLLLLGSEPKRSATKEASRVRFWSLRVTDAGASALPAWAANAAPQMGETIGTPFIWPPSPSAAKRVIVRQDLVPVDQYASVGAAHPLFVSSHGSELFVVARVDEPADPLAKAGDSKAPRFRSSKARFVVDVFRIDDDGLVPTLKHTRQVPLVGTLVVAEAVDAAPARRKSNLTSQYSATSLSAIEQNGYKTTQRVDDSTYHHMAVPGAEVSFEELRWRCFVSTEHEPVKAPVPAADPSVPQYVSLSQEMTAAGCYASSNGEYMALTSMIFGTAGAPERILSRIFRLRDGQHVADHIGASNWYSSMVDSVSASLMPDIHDLLLLPIVGLRLHATKFASVTKENDKNNDDDDDDDDDDDGDARANSKKSARAVVGPSCHGTRLRQIAAMMAEMASLSMVTCDETPAHLVRLRGLDSVELVDCLVELLERTEPRSQLHLENTVAALKLATAAGEVAVASLRSPTVAIVESYGIVLSDLPETATVEDVRAFARQFKLSDPVLVKAKKSPSEPAAVEAAPKARSTSEVWNAVASAYISVANANNPSPSKSNPAKVVVGSWPPPKTASDVAVGDAADTISLDEACSSVVLVRSAVSVRDPGKRGTRALAAIVLFHSFFGTTPNYERLVRDVDAQLGQLETPIANRAELANADAVGHLLLECSVAERWSRLWPAIERLAAGRLELAALDAISVAMTLMLPSTTARIDAALQAIASGRVEVAKLLMARIAETDALVWSFDKIAVEPHVLLPLHVGARDEKERGVYARYLATLRDLAIGTATLRGLKRAAMGALRMHYAHACTAVTECQTTDVAVEWLGYAVTAVQRLAQANDAPRHNSGDGSGDAASGVGGSGDDDDDDEDADDDYDDEVSSSTQVPQFIDVVVVPMIAEVCGALTAVQGRIGGGADGAGSDASATTTSKLVGVVLKLAPLVEQLVVATQRAGQLASWKREWRNLHVTAAKFASVLASVLRSVDVPSVPRALAEWLDTGLLATEAASEASASDRRFLEDVLEARADTDGGALADYMARAHTERQALGKRGGAKVARSERAAAAALLRHAGHMHVARSFATIARHRATAPPGERVAAGDAKARVPLALRQVWERAYQVRAWLINKLHSMDEAENSESAEHAAAKDAVCDAVVERMQLLFGTVPLCVTTAVARSDSTGSSALTLFSSVGEAQPQSPSAKRGVAIGASPQVLFAGRKGQSSERVERQRTGDGRAMLRGSMGDHHFAAETDGRVRALLETYGVWRAFRHRGPRGQMSLSSSGELPSLGGAERPAAAAATSGSRSAGTVERRRRRRSSGGQRGRQDARGAGVALCVRRQRARSPTVQVGHARRTHASPRLALPRVRAARRRGARVQRATPSAVANSAPDSAGDQSSTACAT